MIDMPFYIRNHIQLFSTGTGAEFFRIDGTDPVTGESGTILSEPSPYFDVGLTFEWYKINVLSLKVRFEQYTLQGFNDGQSFYNTEGTLIKYSLKLLNRLTDFMLIGLTASYDQELFFHALSSSMLYVDRGFIPKVGLNLGLQLLDTTYVGFFVEGEAFVTAPQVGEFFYIVLSGQQYGTTAKLQFFPYPSRSPGKRIVELTSSYYVESTPTQITSKEQKSFSFGLNFVWELI